jgi:hypothetical protein
MLLSQELDNFGMLLSIITQLLVYLMCKVILCISSLFSWMGNVPDTASYIRGWIQMVLAPNDLISWNNKYNKYNEYNITDTFTRIFLAMHTTYSGHAGILKPWRGRLPWPLVVFSSCHFFFLPLSGLNWRSLSLSWGSGPPFPKMAPPFTGSAHTPLPGSGTGKVGSDCD